MKSFWAPVVIAICAAAQIPGVMRGSVPSTMGLVFILCIVAASVAIELRR